MSHLIPSLENANLGWLYYKKYFVEPECVHDKKNDANNAGKDTIANRNHTITQRKLQDCKQQFDINAPHGFPLKTTYPGLLIGSGYTHEYGDRMDKDDAIKIGFFFDNVTGLPSVSGHGVKGILRSPFPNHKNEKYKNEKAELIIALLQEKGVNAEEKFNTYLRVKSIIGYQYNALNFAHLLGELIFEGNEPVMLKDNKLVYQQMPLSQKDVFHDSYLLCGNSENLFLANDYITHHENPLRNPNPVQFLKILPSVSLQFQFDLKDNLITANEKQGLFLALIITLGVGAKTNVGYGQMDIVSVTKPPSRELNSLVEVIPKGLDVIKAQNCKGSIEAIEGKYALAVFTISGVELKIKKQVDSFFSKKQRESGALILLVGDKVEMTSIKKDGTDLITTIRKI